MNVLFRGDLSMVRALSSVLLWALAWVASTSSLRAQPKLEWELGPTGSKASLRGLWAVDDKTVWASGSDATVLLSTDGGSSWENVGPPDFEALEFRSLFAWNAREAIIASAGTPAVILKTEDAGKNWREVYRHASEDAFFDGLRFWPRSKGKTERGMVFGDPVGKKEHLFVLETYDGGETWTEVPSDMLPPIADQEAAFAASNSSMIVAPGGRVWIGTGVTKAQRSRVYFRQGWKQKWGVTQVPIPSDATHGIFSLALGGKRLVAVGGDYRPGEQSQMTAAMCDDGGGWWQVAQQPPPEYRSAVVFLPSKIQIPGQQTKGLWITTGPSGTDYSTDGNSWSTFSGVGFHTLAIGGSSVFAAGSDGRFAVLKSDFR